jgi:hypothetical protein
MAVDAQTIRDFVAANIDNPQAIASAAQAAGVSVSDIASAMSLPESSVTSFFSSANVAPPAPASAPITPAPTTAATPLATSQPKVYNIPGVTDQQISVLKQYSPQMWTALQNGKAKVRQVGGQTQIVDSTTGVPFDTSGLQIDVLPNNQLSITGWGGKAQQLGATASIDASGNIAPVTDANISKVNQYGVDYGGISLQQVISIGLAYALPIVGEAIAAELAVSTSVGTALAAVGTGVAQGKTIEESIKGAAPALIASGVMDQVGINDLTKGITDNKQLQNVINNVASSTIKTVAAGGTAQDIFTNAIATGGGTILGDTLDSKFAGQTLATTLATGDTTKGLAAGAGVLGQEEAVRNLVERDVGPIMNAPVAKDVADLNLNDAINQSNLSAEEKQFLQDAKQKIFNQSLIAQALPQTSFSGAQAPAMPTYPFAANDPRFLSAIEKNPGLLAKFSEYTNSYAITPDSAAAMNAAYIPLIEQALAKDPTYQPLLDEYKKVTGNDYKVNQEPTPTTQVGTDYGTITIVAPRIQPEVAPQPDVAPGVGISVGEVTKPSVSPAVAPANQPLITPAAQPSTSPSPETSVATGITPGGITTPPSRTPRAPSVPTAPITPPTPPSEPSTPPKEPTPPSGVPPTAPAIAPITETPSDTTDVSVDTGKKTTEVAPKDQAKPPEEPTVTITTSSVKPQIKAAYPTISGQFANPLTQAISAYRPAGELESQATGKEREDVWNTESLRNALGI